MTDEEMDARLRAAGAAWRTATDTLPAPAKAEPQPLVPPAAATRRRPRTAWLASAAVIVTALVGAGAFVLGRTTDGREHRVTGTESASLEGTVWRLTGYQGRQQLANSLATLYIHDGAFVADDSCNLITGKADVSGRRINVAGVEARYYNCTDSVGEVTFYEGLKTLRNDPRWSIVGGRLTLSGAGPTMHLRAARDLPAPTADRPTVTGATWRLVRVLDAAGKERKLTGDATLRIAGGHLTASDTCNTISGSAHVDGNVLRTSGLANTELPCPSSDVLGVIDGVIADGARVGLQGIGLSLSKAGEGRLDYAWQPSDEQATDVDRLTATEWQLRSVAGDRVEPGTILKITKDGVLTVRAACEAVTGSAKVTPGVLVGTSPKNPRAGCPPELSTLHSFLQGREVLWRIAGDRLVINESGAQAFALVFAPAKDVPASSVELPGTWTLTQVEEDNGNSASGRSVPPTTARLQFDGRGHFRIDERCRWLAGDAEPGASEIRFSGVAIHEHSCPYAPNENQADLAAVGRVASGTATWAIRNGQLVLKQGNVTLTFARG